VAINTKSIYQPADPEDGKRVLVTRYYPRGVKKDRFDIWLRELSPSAKLLKSYRESKIDWSLFSAAYVNELKSNTESIESIQTLRSLAGHSSITLLCYEKEGMHCHRHLLKDMIDNPDLLAGAPPR